MESNILNVLKKANQTHLVEAYHACDDVQAKKAFLHQIENVENTYPGGCVEYTQIASNLMHEALEGKSKFDDYELAKPETYSLGLNNLEELLHFEKRGLEELKTIGFMILAGGLGERMGYHGIKPAISLESFLDVSFFQIYMDTIKGIQNLYPGENVKIQVAIMTSCDTNDRLLLYLKENQYFGLDKDQFHVMKQEKVPCFMDGDCKFMFADNDPQSLKIAMKPHGHGDIHQLMHLTGTAKQMYERGTRWVVTCNDTNPLSFRYLAAYLGLTIEKDFHLSYLAIQRIPGEATGALCKIKKGEHFITTNIEYNIMSKMLHKCNPVDPETGYSIFPGNTNIMLMHLGDYVNVLEKTHGHVPEFINPKFKPNSKELKSATRLESLVSEYPWLLQDQKIGIVMMDRTEIFTCAKNHIAGGIDKFKAGLPMSTIASCEFDWYYSNCVLLKEAAGVEFKVEEGSEYTLDKNGIPLKTLDMCGAEIKVPPIVGLFPSFAVTVGQLQQRLQGKISITPQSTLLLKGNAEIKDLELDGSLQIEGTEGHGDNAVVFNSLTVDDKNYVDITCAMESPETEKEKLRGFKVTTDVLKTINRESSLD